MDILNYTEEHRIFRDSLRRFLEREITPHVEEWEEAGIVPKEAWKQMGEQGFLAMGVSEEYGGLGADFRAPVPTASEGSHEKGDATPGRFLPAAASGVSPICRVTIYER